MFEQQVDADEDLPTGENLILSASFDKDGEDPPQRRHRHADAVPRRHEGRRGPDQDPAGQVLDRRRGARASAATAATRSRPTTRATAPWASPAARIHRVRVDVSGEPYLDLEREAQAMLMRE